MRHREYKIIARQTMNYAKDILHLVSIVVSFIKYKNKTYGFETIAQIVLYRISFYNSVQKNIKNL